MGKIQKKLCPEQKISRQQRLGKYAGAWEGRQGLSLPYGKGAESKGSTESTTATFTSRLMALGTEQTVTRARL